MNNYDFKIHTYKEDNNKYSYIMQYENGTSVNYLSSMANYDSHEEARIAARLLHERNYMGERNV